MSDINNIVPSYLDLATEEEKNIFFQTLFCLSVVDGKIDDEEINFITQAAEEQGIENVEQLKTNDIHYVIDNVKKIKNRHLALELVREMCMLAHVDNVLSNEETLFIGEVGLAMGVEIEKIEQISNWIIDRIIWLEQAKMIFEVE